MWEKSSLEPGFSIVIPVYNGERTIGSLVAGVLECMRLPADSLEILLVEDGSRDRSWDEIENLASQYPQVRGIALRRNYGQHNALICGVRSARFDTIVTMDDDLQHPPSEISKLVARLQEGDCDVVYGMPRHAQQTLFRTLCSVATKGLLALGSPDVNLQSPFRAFRTSLREAFPQSSDPDILLDVLLSWGTQRFVGVPVRYDPRREGVSNYNLRLLIRMGLLLVTAYSTAPLRFATWTGFGFTLFGMAVLAYVLYVYLFVGSLPGFPFLASLIAVFSGAQLFALGMLGEYLGRVFNRTLGRPVYVIREVTKKIDH